MRRIMLKLLVGYDASEFAADAIGDLARAGLPRTDVEATVLSIADLLPGVLGEDLVRSYPPVVLQKARLHAQQELTEAQKTSEEGAQRVRRIFGGWKVQADAAADSPYWGLIKRASERHTDMLVVGSQGRSALGRLMLGSVSHSAVLYAPCSTRIGRRRDEEQQDAVSSSTPVRIMIGWDGSVGAAAAVNAAASRHWPVGSRARLVSAIDTQLATALPALLPGEPFALPLASSIVSVASDPSEMLRASATSAGHILRAAGLEVEEPLLRPGDPKHLLVEEADSWLADCIFVGARGLSRVERILLGSVSGAVAARANCSVEVVRKSV